MSWFNERMLRRARGEDEMPPRRADPPPPPLKYQSNPGHTLVWTHAYPMAWEREDGVKVIQHQSPPGEWCIADSRVHAHTGWFVAPFGAMDVADIMLGDQRQEEG